MTVKLLNLQDSFLNQIRKENIPVIVYLANGFQYDGQRRLRQMAGASYSQRRMVRSL